MSPSFIRFPWRAVIRMSGRDRARFLHGMCTNDIKQLQPGQGCRAAVVNRQGKMVADLAVLAATDALLLVVERSNLRPTIDALSRFLVADDVNMEASDLAVVGVYATPPPPGLPTLADPSLHVEGHLILVPDSGYAFPDLQEMTEGEYENFRIENGFPRWGVDMGPDVLPMEAGLDPIAISYTKGCYIGQEVIQRVKTYSEPPRMLVQFQIEGARPQEKVTAGADEIGHVTSATTKVALGYVRKEFKAPGTKVAVGGREAIVRALPWHARLT